MRRFIILGIVGALVVTAGNGHCAPAAGSHPAAFNAANKLYEEGKFADAATAYERLLQTGVVSGALYFNWGNAQFKAGQIGRAIAAYRQAADFAPRDPDLRANLQFAREQVQGPTVRLRWRERLLGELSLDEWTVAAAAALWFWLALLVVRQLRPTLRRSLRILTLFAATSTVVLGTGLGLGLRARLVEQGAIIFTRDATVRNGPFEESPVAFTAHDGAELLVLDRKEDWLQVAVDGRRPGWIARKHVLVTPAR